MRNFTYFLSKMLAIFLYHGILLTVAFDESF